MYHQVRASRTAMLFHVVCFTPGFKCGGWTSLWIKILSLFLPLWTWAQQNIMICWHLKTVGNTEFYCSFKAFISPLSLSATVCSLICLREKVVRKQEKTDTWVCCGLAYISGRAALCSFSQPSTRTTNINFKSEIICISTISDSLTNTLLVCQRIWSNSKRWVLINFEGQALHLLQCQTF